MDMLLKSRPTEISLNKPTGISGFKQCRQDLSPMEKENVALLNRFIKYAEDKYDSLEDNFAIF
jgi:hypothetical protein